MPSPNAQMKRGIALATLAAALFGMTAPLLKEASAGVGVLRSGALVYFGAALGAALMVLRRGQPRGPSPLRSSRARLLIVAVLGAVVAPALLVAGLHRVDGATASLLLALEAPFTIVLARAFLGEFIGRRVLAASLLIMVGGALLVGAAVGSGVTATGSVLVAAATLAWSLDNLLSRPLADQDPLRVVAVKGLIGAVLSGAVGMAAGDAHPSLRQASALVLLGVAGYGVSLQLYLRAQRVVGAARTASVFATAPFVGVIVAFLLGAPWPGVMLPIAAALIAAGVLLHLSEHHEHAHRHQPIEHEHEHRHDDGHHQHVHDPVPPGAHTHPHRHPAVTHQHEHSEDIHHRHVHDDRKD